MESPILIEPHPDLHLCDVDNCTEADREVSLGTQRLWLLLSARVRVRVRVRVRAVAAM